MRARNATSAPKASSAKLIRLVNYPPPTALVTTVLPDDTLLLDIKLASTAPRADSTPKRVDIPATIALLANLGQTQLLVRVLRVPQGKQPQLAAKRQKENA